MTFDPAGFSTGTEMSAVRRFLQISLGASVFCLFGCIVALVSGVGWVEQCPPLRFESEPFVVPFGADWSGEGVFAVRVVNDSDRPARILGALQYCGSACFSGVGLPADVPARGQGEVHLLVSAGRPGPISDEVVFFTDEPSQPRLTLRVAGIVPEVVNRGALTHAAKP